MTLHKLILSIAFGLFFLVLLYILINRGRLAEVEPPEEVSSHTTDLPETAPPQAILPSWQGVPISYRIGLIDPRFGIREEQLTYLLKEAEEVWEKPVGIDIFQLSPAATMKVSLVFDERQQRRVDERRLKATLDDRGKSYDILLKEYEAQMEWKQRMENEYNSDLAVFNRKTKEYNSTVSYWNKHGGVPPDVHSQLDQDRQALDSRKDLLESKRAALNGAVATANKLAQSINELIARYKLDIKHYNGRFVQPREFEKGVFNGTEINIYQFDDESDLKLAIVHELGHALGFGHVGDAAAVMYYKLESQDARNIQLKEADRDLLRKRFPGRLAEAQAIRAE